MRLERIEGRWLTSQVEIEGTSYGRTLDAPGEFTTTASTRLQVDELRTRLTH